ncbi:hypothetical protein LOK49_LG01G00590 [Camellia lanceoleosa]|uniref:Uncharacterized protein n=1 Tax=Camellia lanceoleosa TaxID=1840588 RepID=A0ACC0ITK7_9ERIC|nr:hypothetical protein LOK49_LG01G00590 [Camellia lanceoleosa]
MATTYLREDRWTNSSGTEVGSEYSKERRSLRPDQVFHPSSHHHFLSDLSMELDDSTWQLKQHELERCLIGYVVDVRRFGSYLMQIHVNDLWNLEGSVHVYGRSKNHFVFLFERMGDMDCVADNGPYALEWALLIVDYWKPDLVLDRLIFDKMMIWVQLYGLPLNCYTEEARFNLGRAIREVVKVDIDPLMPCNIRFLRLQVKWAGDFIPKVMIQETHPMYSASIRANAHRMMTLPICGNGIGMLDYNRGCPRVVTHCCQLPGGMEFFRQYLHRRCVQLFPMFFRVWVKFRWICLDQASLVDSNEEVLRALQTNGPRPRLNIPMGEAPINTRAFTISSPQRWTNVGSVTFEVDQTSSMIDNGPQNSTLITEPSPFSPSFSFQSWPPIRKRMREVDSGFELLYDTESMATIDEISGPLGDREIELAMHRAGIVSDSMCYPHRLGYFLRKQ